MYVLLPMVWVCDSGLVYVTVKLAVAVLIEPLAVPANVKLPDLPDDVSVIVRPTENGLLLKTLGFAGSTALRPMLEVRLMSEEPVAEPFADSKKITLFVPLSAVATWGVGTVL